jgi:competence protein ComEC
MTREGYGPSFFRLADSWRQSFFAFTASSMNKDDAEWADAICFRSGALPMESREALKRTGTVHVVAASGLHVFAIALAFQWLLGLLPVPRWVVVAAVSSFLALYAMAVGLHPPVLRAALMSVAFLAAYLLRREPDGLSALGTAAIACLIWNPAGVLDAGFQLSFVAVASLIVFHRRPAVRPRTAVGLVLQRLGQLAWASTVLALAMEPLVAYHMGMVSLVSIPANIAVVAVASALLPLSTGAFGLSLLAPGAAGALMSLLASPLIGVVKWVADVLGGLPFATLEVPPFNAYWLVAYFAAGLLLWREQPRPASD